MYQIQTLNEISPVIYEALDNSYQVGKSVSAPDAVLVRSADMHAMEMPASLLAIGRAGAGVNNIPVDSCAQAGIVVFNTPGANANAVAELVIAGLLLGSRNIVGGIAWAEGLKGQGDAVPKLVEKGKGQFVGPELSGKTLGVIGLGAIGALVANAAHGMGMDVIGYDPYISVEHAWRLSRSIGRAVSLEELLAKSDYLTVHVPLMEKTRNMFDASAFAQMKDGACLLNFSRGELVDTQAVLDALSTGKVRKYVTDFPCDALLCAPGVLCIPHLGASTPESEDNCARMAAQQVRDYLEQGTIRNSVNLPDVDLQRTDTHRITIIHQNIPNMLGSITALVAKEGVNIANMINKSRGAMAYTVLDTDETVSPAVLASLQAMEGILRVRTIG